MEKQVEVHLDNKILFNDKNKLALKSLICGRNFIFFKWMKPKWKKLHTIWIQLYDILEKSKL